jgi:predicted dehydrogenase
MIEVALFGAGRIGNIHAGNLARHPGVRLKYIADVNRAAAVDLAVKHRAGGPRTRSLPTTRSPPSSSLPAPIRMRS